MSELDIALEQIAPLVEAFQRNEGHYKSAGYKEAAARKDFIDKLWIALGWDVNADSMSPTRPADQPLRAGGEGRAQRGGRRATAR